jgi:hypothetical protein
MLSLANLDASVREKMLFEVDRDIAAGSLYMCPRFNANGKRLYVDLLRQAVQFHDDEWLADQLRRNVCFNETEVRDTKHGAIVADIPYTAATTLAEGEFNCFYMRGLCAIALERGIPELEIYRARESENPRYESRMMVGKMIDAKSLWADLRMHTGVNKALHLPPGPNSGLSARLPVTTQ